MPIDARRAHPLLPALLFAVAVAAYLPSLNNDAVYDDVHLVEKDRRVTESGHLAAIWTSDYWPGNRPSYNYRPLTTMSFALVARLSLNQRAVNLILHGLCAILVFLILRRLSITPILAFIGGALFALHPLSSEALYLIVGRGELLAALFGFAMLWGVLRRVPFFVLSLLYTAALFSKESAVVLPLLALLIHHLAHSEQSLKDLFRFAGKLALFTIPPLALVLVMRYQAFGMLLTPSGYVDPFYNPLADLPADVRVLNGLWGLLLYLKSLVWPYALSADYSCCQLGVAMSWATWKTAVVLLAFALLATLLMHRPSRWTPEVGGVLFVLFALLPVSNILFLAGVFFGERLAYLPSLGFVLFTGAILQRAGERLAESPAWKRALPLGLAALLLVAFATTTIRRDADWQNDAAFSSAVVRTSPRSAFAHALRYLHENGCGDFLSAEKELRTSLRIYPKYHDAWASLAILLAKRGATKEAIAAYEHAADLVAKRPLDAKDAGFLLGKAVLLQTRLGQCAAAKANIERAKRWVKPEHRMFRELGMALQMCRPGSS